MRAYIILTRNDLEENMLELSDLRPSAVLDMSARNPQMGYLSRFVKDEAVTLEGSGPYTLAQETNGLAAYLIDNVENAGTNVALTSVQAHAIADEIKNLVDAGASLTLSDLNTAINGVAGVASSDLDGTASNSTGSVAEVLSILSGDDYIVPEGAVLGGAANAFPLTGGSHIRTGTLVKRTHNIVATSELRKSLLNGKLSELYSYAWKNPKFTYGTGGTAKSITGADLPATGIAATMTVYGEDGLNYWG